MCRWRGFVVVLLLAAFANADDEPWQLNSLCPPSFEKVAGRCQFRSLYLQYDSLQNAGVGGLKTALPDIRDGFTPEQIDLGRLLFFDPLLSADGDMACSSCHQPDKGFSDGLGQSLGRHGHAMQRSAPSLWNSAFLKRFFWDARADSLEQQLLGPLFSANEMATTPNNLLAALNGNPVYLDLFAQAYPDFSGQIKLAQVYTALSAFEASLISLNSRYDWYAHGHHSALNSIEIEGLNVFRSFVARCAECHTPPLFTNQQIAVLGTPEPEGKAFDAGAQVPRNDPSLRGGFKVPSLRNVARTAPYMHSGRFSNLREAVAFYTGGRGHAVPPGEKLNLHWHIWEPQLADHELDALVAFLKTLTDETFMPVVPTTLPSGLKPVSGENAVANAGEEQ